MDASYMPVTSQMGSTNNASIYQKFKVVLWKNFIIRKRHWFLTICEIAIPLVLFILMAYTRSKIDGMGKKYIPTPTYSPELSSEYFYYNKFNAETQIYYTPQSDFTVNLMRKVQMKLQKTSEGIRGFDSEADLIEYYETFGRNYTVMGVVFKNLQPNRVPKQLDYTIRPFERYVDWETRQLFNSIPQYIPGSGSANYIDKGFIAIKMALDASFIETLTSQKLPFDLTLQEFPYPPYFNDAGITEMFSYGFPLVTLFGFSLLCVAVVKRIVEEKSTGIKELMMMMGLKSWMLWLGWFIHAFVVNFVSVLIIVFFMKVALWDAKYPPIEHCDPSLLTVFLLLYCAAGISFCFAISSIFNRPTLAMVAGILVWILTYSIPSAVVDQAPNMKWNRKILLGIFPNMAMTYGYKAISMYESREVGASWSNLFTSASGGTDDVNMGNVFMMFIFDIVFYILVTVYVENIKPGPYGLAKPLHFPFLYIRNRFNRSKSKIKENEETFNSNDYCKIEPAPELRKGIQVKNLYKKYGKAAAVNGLSIDIYEGQITALLGHNGAGKTTTMSIITGMIGATSGTVLVNGQDIKTNMSNVRGSLGLCPQHNLQFTDLTVLEHLIFFGMLKGLSRQEAELTAHDLLGRMNLSSKKHCLASSLSGGMRRRLSLGIALIGDSKVLILDEPTSGLDPEARREIWDMLLSLRGSRTIIITTHFMEEADVLGDRIAIMDHGRLFCYGTPMFLKKEYGTGYHLTVIRDKEKFQTKSQNQVDLITRIVRENIKDLELQPISGNNLTYLLPHEAKPQFSQLLSHLENEKNELGIINIAMSVTTLEEVFLKVGDLTTGGQYKNGSIDRRSLGNRSVHSTDSSISSKYSGVPLLYLRVRSLLKKRFWVLRKKWMIPTIQVALAIIITILTLYLGENALDTDSEQFAIFNFDLSKYGVTGVIYGGEQQDTLFVKFKSEYDNLVSEQRGIPEKVINGTVSDGIIKKGIDNIEYYKQHMIVAAEFNSTGPGKGIVNAMYSSRAVHGAPIALNLVMNAVLKGILGEEYGISSANYPLPVYSDNYLEEASEGQIVVLWFTLFPLGLLFLAGTFVLYPLMERATNIKQLQLMCGVRSFAYWLTCYVFDLLLYVVAVILVLLFVSVYGAIFPSSTFTGFKVILALFVILFVYGMCVIPYSYLFSYKKTAAGGFASFIMISLFTSIIMTITVVVMELSGVDYYVKLGNNIKTALLLFPQFGLTYLSVKFSQKTVWNHNWVIKSQEHRDAMCRVDPNPCCDGLNSPECIKYQSYFRGEDNITAGVLEMAASTTIYFSILLLLDTTFVKRAFDSLVMYLYNLRVKKHKTDVTDTVKNNTKDDVRNEMERVYNTLKSEKSHVDGPRRSDEERSNLHFEHSEEDDLLLVHNLEKTYWNNKVVKGVSFGIKPGDCFGLLGVNGAGKTTTFKMLTGDEPLLIGDARISDHAKNKVYISSECIKYLEKVGYCPQFDAINEVLTGREMLSLFAQLRGISENVDREVNMWLAALGLEDYADKPCGEYSGGNKRKLSIAVALIGGPLLVMLDEPTSGVDPVSRRKLWDTLVALQNRPDKPSILLTSHSMEECEALCNKLAIMKAGQLECYGTIPELKQKYGQGFTVMLKLKAPTLTITVNPLAADTHPSTASSESRSIECPPTTNRNATSAEESEDIKELRKEFEEKYRGHCSLRDKHSGLLHYHISDKDKRWSELFKEIEEFKQTHPIIEDYNISETTLEEVFLSIARAEN